MIKVKDIYDFLKTVAPEDMAMETDNVGLLVGKSETNVSKILIALDITSDVITEAVDSGAGLIVAHHPLFFSLKTVTDTDITGKKIVQMLSNGISCICMHTNLDAVSGGVNDALAVAIGIADDTGKAEPLSDTVRLKTGEVVSLGRVGSLNKACSMTKFLASAQKALGANGLRYYDAGRDVYKVAIASGSGGSEWDNAVKSGCDTFVTADIKYHMFLDAKELGINLVDGGHYCTENVVSAVLAEKLCAAFPEIEINLSKALDQTIMFY